MRQSGARCEGWKIERLSSAEDKWDEGREVLMLLNETCKFQEKRNVGQKDRHIFYFP